MTTTYKIPGYFTAPATPLEALERERERIQVCADRNAQHYANILREMDEEIEALRAKSVQVGVVESETPQIPVFSRMAGNSTGGEA